MRARERTAKEPNRRLKLLPLANYSSALVDALEQLGNRFVLAIPKSPRPEQTHPQYGFALQALRGEIAPLHTRMSRLR